MAEEISKPTIEEQAPAPSFNGTCIILGFTGSLGSGCSFISKGLCEKLNHARAFKPSDYIRQLAAERNLEASVEVLQSIGDEIRGTLGKDGKPLVSSLISKCIELVNQEHERTQFTDEDDGLIIIDGIKNSGEVKLLRQFPNFYLISVHAKYNIRLERLTTGREPRFKSVEDFELADKRDQDEDLVHGQQIKACNYLADIIIHNDTQFHDTEPLKKSEFVQKFINEYLYPIQQARKGQAITDRPPNIQETFMTAAYCVSKSSNCMKRKVGAVIVHERTMKAVTGEEYKRYQIISSGCNDVPAGKPCVFEQGQCYRDKLQEEFAKKLIFCPQCGTKIPDTIKCPHCGKETPHKNLNCPNEECRRDLLANYKCSQCGCKIFSHFLPGQKDTPGKLLDMCRALHAEENAMLSLSGIAKPETAETDLILYTTTFPCNLCANKIISTGIKTIYYAEPYTMKESEELLKKFNVNLIEFEGIKSTAYFRLYN